MKLFIFLCAVAISASTASVIRGRILVDPDCGGLVGVTREDVVVAGQFVDEHKLKQINDFVTPVEIPNRHGLVPPKVESVKTDVVKGDEETGLIKDVFGMEEKKDDNKEFQDLDKFLEQRPTTTEAPRFEEPAKSEQFLEQRPVTTEAPRFEEKYEQFNPTDNMDDGSYKPERDNTELGKYDDGSYKPETPLFVYDKPLVATDPCALCAEQNAVVETPNPNVYVDTAPALEEKPYYFETSSEVLQQPTFVQPPTVVPEPCEEPQFVVPEPVRSTFVVETPKVVAPVETINPPVQNILKSDGTNFVTGPWRTPSFVVPQTPPETVVPSVVRTPEVEFVRREPFVPVVSKFETPTPQYVFAQETVRPDVQNVVRNDQTFRFDVTRPETVVRTETFTETRGETTLVEEPCDDTKVVVDNTPTLFVRNEEVLKPAVQNVVRSETPKFFIDTPKPEFVVRETPQLYVRPESYFPTSVVRSEEVVRPAVQTVATTVVQTPTVVKGAFTEPCDPIFESNLLIHK